MRRIKDLPQYQNLQPSEIIKHSYHGVPNKKATSTGLGSRTSSYTRVGKFGVLKKKLRKNRKKEMINGIDGLMKIKIYCIGFITNLKA